MASHALLVCLVAAIGLPLDGSSADRSGTDRPDVTTGPLIHLLYVLPSDAPDLRRDQDGSLFRLVESAQRWFSAETDGRTRLRIDSSPQGTPDITFLRIRETAAEVREIGAPNALTPVGKAMTAAGMDWFNDFQRKRYVIFYDGGGPFSHCGFSGSLTIVFLQCGPDLPVGSTVDGLDWLSFTFAHEVIHLMVAVMQCAPHYTANGGGHVTGPPNDIMYDGVSSGPLVWPPHLDVGRDDYFGHGRTDCPDVAKSQYLDPFPRGWGHYSLFMGAVGRD